MKILFVSNDPSIFNEQSGARKRMREYADVIGELHIISRAPKGTEQLTEGALTLHPFLGSKIDIFRTLPDRIGHLIETYGIEVVSAQDPFEYGWASVEGVKNTNAKLHVQVHTDFLSPWFSRESIKNFLRVLLADYVLPKAQGIRVVSERIRDSLTSRYENRISTVAVIPLTVRGGESTPVPLPPHSFSFVFLTAGRLEPEKRVTDLVEAFALVTDSLPEVGLIVIGEGSERKKLERLITRLSLNERVLLIGWYEGTVAGLMKNADAYIQASAYEGYSRTLIEAALVGLPSITTDVGVVGEVLAHDKDVLVATSHNPVLLAEAITKMATDAPLRAMLATHAKQVTEQHVAQFKDLSSMVTADLERTLRSS